MANLYLQDSAQVGITGACSFGRLTPTSVTRAETSAVVTITGNHVLNGTMEAKDTGKIVFNDSSLTNGGSGDPAVYNLGMLYANAGTIEANSNRTLLLAGVRYKQTGSATTILNQLAQLSVGDNTAYANGSTSYDKNIDVSGGTVKMYPNSALETINGDIRFSNSAKLDIYSPASWQIDTTMHIGSASLSAGGTNRTATFKDSTQIRFNNYTPPGATNVIQNGVQLFSLGNLSFADTTAISLRYGDGFWVVNNCTISTSATISASGTPPGTTYNWSVIECLYGSLTGTFANHGSPPAGWSWAAGSPAYGTSSLTFSWVKN